MPNDIPETYNTKKIAIICEGLEEEAYISRLKELKVFSECYSIFPINAGGIGSIYSYYQDAYQNDSYDLVLIFCDTEKAPYDDLMILKEKLYSLHGVDSSFDELVIFSNPCTMDIIIKHFDNIKLKSNSKSVNSPIIYKYTNIKNYDAHEKQVNSLISKLNADNYKKMKKFLKNCDVDYKVLNSTNFLKFINHFESPNVYWINEINELIENDEEL